MDGGVPDLENIVIPGQGAMKLIDVSAALAKSTVTWEDMMDPRGLARSRSS